MHKLTWLKSGDNISLYTDVRGLLSYVRTNHGAVFRRAVLSAMLESTKNLIKTQCKVESRDREGNRLGIRIAPAECLQTTTYEQKNVLCFKEFLFWLKGDQFDIGPFFVTLKDEKTCKLFFSKGNFLFKWSQSIHLILRLWLYLIIHFLLCRIPVGSYPHIDSQESPLCSIADENETSKLTYKKSVFKKKSTSSTGTVSWTITCLKSHISMVVLYSRTKWFLCMFLLEPPESGFYAFSFTKIHQKSYIFRIHKGSVHTILILIKSEQFVATRKSYLFIVLLCKRNNPDSTTISTISPSDFEYFSPRAHLTLPLMNFAIFSSR